MDTLYLTPDELQNFVQFWVSKGIKPNLFYNGNWAGKTRAVVNTEGTCHRPESIMTVLSDGKVALCCYDLEGEVTFGDLNTQTIKEIWESDALENYRFLNDAGRRSELKLCASCTTG
jgi:radical SAM protein with 4Fe4S-binding SPASM domain